MVANKSLIYAKVPTGMPKSGEHLVITSSDFDPNNVPEGGLTVEIYSLSLDPYMRGRMRDPSTKSYSPPYELGKPIDTSAIARVLKSNSPDYAEGDLVRAWVPFSEYAAVPKALLPRVQKLNNANNLAPENFLGPLGMPGLTAYSAFYKIGKPQKGETIFINAASGAVGQVAGQIAKAEGLRVIGSVGSDDKLEFIKQLGYDDGFNYKKEKPSEALKRLAPNGIDIYFENVGGEHFEAALENMNKAGRIIVCGMISGYNQSREERYGVRNLFEIVARQLVIEGFLVGDKDFGPVYSAEHQKKVGQWIADGTFKPKLHVTNGMDHAAEAFLDLFEGRNFGKVVLKLKE